MADRSSDTNSENNTMGSKKTLEEKIRLLMDKIEELRDLQIVNKLDIINLKNELDKRKLFAPSGIHLASEDIEELLNIIGKSKELKNYEKLFDDIQKIKSILRKHSPKEIEGDETIHGKIILALKALNYNISKMERGKLDSFAPEIKPLPIPEQKPEGIDKEQMKEIIQKISFMEAKVQDLLGGVKTNEINEVLEKAHKLEDKINEISTEINDIKSSVSKIGQAQQQVPAPPEELLQIIRNNTERYRRLADEISNIKQALEGVEKGPKKIKQSDLKKLCRRLSEINIKMIKLEEKHLMFLPKSKKSKMYPQIRKTRIGIEEIDRMLHKIVHYLKHVELDDTKKKTDSMENQIRRMAREIERIKRYSMATTEKKKKRKTIITDIHRKIKTLSKI